MIKTQYPKLLWDHCNELEARACTAHSHYLLDGEVPETVIKGHTEDISTIREYEWYEQVMYNDTTWKLPDPKFVLGQYLGPDIDVGSKMTANILKKTGEVIPQFTLRPLTMEEMENPDFKEQRCNFYEAVIAKIGDTATKTDFLDKGLTQTYDAYANDMTEGTPNAPDKDLEPTPEAGENYVNKDVMFPCGGILSLVRVIERNCDAHGDIFGRANENPILDSQCYLFEFEDGE